ncbi:MAG: asparagine synthase (glutamine-hydrolyzing) [Candidatus Rokubacteria bacterium 13_1_40CM_69_27]|nr:MAG: asparagine synthase (glutamine-hydrolyzing) [Candidatus Rokubacteria bacterium 13_1_40CM_69_27]
MCGIAGFIAPPDERADRSLLERMAATLRHRGPDAMGYHVDGRVGLAVARLRIIDLVRGDQPLANEDASIHVILNGEIYNFPALRDGLTARGHRFATASDTEVIAHAWEEAGEACLEDFNGMFAFALWDRRRQTLLLARDRMGEKPLYYARAGGWLVFASELRALLAHPAVGRRLDLEGVARYLAYDYVPDPHAIVQGVEKLPPAHRLIASDGKLSIQRYWEIPFRPDPALDEAACREEIRHRLDAAVRLRLTSDVPLGCFLSGGIDSTSVAATAARLCRGLRTFSVGFVEPDYDERGFARLVAERIGAVHEELVVSASDAGAVLPRLGLLLDEPIADMSFVPLYLLSCAARRHITVALTGDGGDELFAGYPAMAAAWWQSAFAALPRPVPAALRAAAERFPFTPEPLREFLDALAYRPSVRNQLLVGGVPPHRYAGLLSADARAQLATFDPYADIDRALDGCAVDDPTARLIYRYCKTYLAGQNLANADRASMATGLELRAPFLDHTFVEFTGRIPSRLKLRGLGQLKRLLKEALVDRLPPEIRARGKQGFGVPFGAWFRGPLAGALREILSPERMRAGGVFDPGAVERLVTEHIAGRRDQRKVLWALVVFELWRSAHLDQGR